MNGIARGLHRPRLLRVRRAADFNGRAGSSTDAALCQVFKIVLVIVPEFAASVR